MASNLQNMKDILEEILGITEPGEYQGGFYTIDIDSSDDFAKYQSRLDKIADDAENPGAEFEGDNLSRWVNYYTIETEGGEKYSIFLIADFNSGEAGEDKYQLKIKKAVKE